MTNNFAADVLICGAGAAGLTLAIELARRGVSFRLIERKAAPFPGSRGKGIQPRTQEVFEDLGILDKVVATGGVYPPMRDYRSDGSFIEKDLGDRSQPTSAEPYRIPLMIPQFLTEKIMRERLAELECEVEFGCGLVGFEQDDDGVTAHLTRSSGEERVRVRYLVGADGGRSFVRHALGIAFPGKTLGVRAIVADAALTGLDRDIWWQFNSGDMQRMIAICPLGGTELFQIQAPVPPEGDVDLSAEGMERMIAERTDRSDIAVHSVNWASAYAMNARIADSYRVGRIFLAGDAAHTHPPTGGQGLNTSVQDSYNLGWKLAAVLRGAPHELLDSYEIERRPVAEEVLGLSSRLLDAGTRGEISRGREVHQLDIGYPQSPLALEAAGRTHGLRAGQRAPDAPTKGAAGQPSRLFLLFAGPHWTLLVNGQRTIASRPGLRIHHLGERGDILDVFGCVHDAYGLAPDECVLIRPDGYVGATLLLSAQGIAQLETYLDGVGLPPLNETSKRDAPALDAERAQND
ncbi:2-polyprenyl-6-methoxyphenol hydroxylase-like FAD-dependent oxidoreductase [Neorhizobium sp. 2083]|uniref:FAD-dependent oxidoreductase n=1 Tax=Neorhizobium sp. 2083 TaxID=2817762 RepID=UPI002860B501|nr:FAD-dependent oxidoreductase [Neorhizobium sp. 2083]MDR6820778.1 2-polyprenyl-6-methoxyphenol hydroxylase-like FAD-dependent oxidoreductase [Neorhizobium sp. 2083]